MKSDDKKEKMQAERNEIKMKKALCLLLSLVMVICASTTTIVANATAESTGTEVLFDPGTGEYVPVCNVEKEISAITAECEPDEEFEKLFEQKRMMQKELASETACVNTLNFSAPVPGGIGYGVLYNSDYQSDFSTGTTIAHDIVCPTTPGGDVNTWLYLTSTNRAAKGVEAFILYKGQDNFCFKVFDWARPEGQAWQVSIPYSEMTPYLTKKNVNGVNRQSVTVQNTTVQVSSTQWKNVVHLMNYSTGVYDQVYSYTYTATLADQRKADSAWWGPIVETFQDSYNKDTNIMGFSNTWMHSKTSVSSSDTWKDWERLTSSNSHIGGPSKGFEMVYLQPNYTFLVH